MGHLIEFKKSARKSLEALPQAEHARTLRAIAVLAENPRPVGCKKLHGENLWRIRVGDVRIVYEIFDYRLLVFIVRIAHRSKVYKKL
ncbi:MAG: type II toxin-antitoxin system RelE family toxin [Aminivibrio sp.]|jgi:mRNA interferase RelE/StbE